MRGKIARALRRVMKFDPHEKRDYMHNDKAVIFETENTKDGKDTFLTKRSLYRIAKKKYVRENEPFK